MSYEEMYEDPLREIGRILDVLQLSNSEVTPARVQSVVEFRFNDSNRNNRSAWDSRTGYYTQHIRDPAPGRWRKNITQYADDLIRLEKSTYEWMKAKGYTPHFPESASVKASSKSMVGSFQAFLEPPPMSFGRADLCPLSAAAHNIGLALPAGTAAPQWLQPKGMCDEYPFICAHPYLFVIGTFIFFLIFFLFLFLGCVKLVFYCFPLPQDAKTTAQRLRD